jgi:RNA polymerase sigma-70 factor, ECF subfamily
MNHTNKLALFERIEAQYSPLLESVIWRLTGDRDQFAEAYQNAMLALWRHIEKLDQGRPAGYIYRIALSAVSKAWRSRPRHGAPVAEPLDLQNPMPDDLLMRRERYAELRQHILDLPTKQGQAVAMRYLQGKTYAQVAEDLQCKESAARAQVSRALIRLKQKMAPISVKETNHE